MWHLLFPTFMNPPLVSDYSLSVPLVASPINSNKLDSLLPLPPLWICHPPWLPICLKVLQVDQASSTSLISVSGLYNKVLTIPETSYISIRIPVLCSIEASWLSQFLHHKKQGKAINRCPITVHIKIPTYSLKTLELKLTLYQTFIK